jgi:3'(2'), 5'-bisphosphate nucleotidase
MINSNALRSLIPPLGQIVCEAGRAILEVYGTKFEVDFKEDASPLTMADRRSHDIILARLTPLVCPSLFSDPVPVLSEEGRDIAYGERAKWRYFWMVDPLDGTKEFVKRNGEFTINIALIENNFPILGVVYVPVHDVMYCGFSKPIPGQLAGQWAAGFSYRFSPAGNLSPPGGSHSGPGSDSNKLDSFFEKGERLPLRSQGDPDPHVLRVAGSRSHSGEAFEAYLEEKRKEYPRVEVLYAGSALKFCVVAEGSADVYPRFGPTMEWDTAAGHAVAKGAGKAVKVHPSGEEPRYNNRELSYTNRELSYTNRELGYNKRDLRNRSFICR